MKVFHFSPSNARRETIQAFNQRVADFCAENDVVIVQSSAAHDGVALSLTTPDDLPMVPPVVLQPMVIPVQGADLANLEQIANSFIGQVAAASTDEDPRLPAQVQLVMRTDQPAAGYLVVLVNIGLLDDGSGQAGEA